MSDRLGDIDRLTRMILDTELAELKARADRVAAKRCEIEAHRRARAARHEAVGSAQPGSDDLAFSVGQDLVWQDWLGRELARLNAELAQAAADREAQRQKASLAFGRVDAVSRLGQRLRDARRLEQARRPPDG